MKQPDKTRYENLLRRMLDLNEFNRLVYFEQAVLTDGEKRLELCVGSCFAACRPI